MTQNSPAPQRIQNLLNRARQVLSARRVLHTLGVTHAIMTLAELHGLSIEHAAMAGLLHDQSKEIKPEQILHDLTREHDVLPKEDLGYPNTWHGHHAALLGRIELGIIEIDVLEAVSLHTTADAGIGLLTKALFVADMCEPNRDLHHGPEIMRAARLDLEEGFRQALLHKARHVANKKRATLHPKALRALRAYMDLNLDDLFDFPGQD